MARILVIDDEPSMLDLLDTVLRRKGHEVVLTEHGQKGVKLFQREHPHVTILDLKIPDMDGLVVLKEIRTFDPNAPVIILKGFGTEESVRQARKLGVTEFLQKGFSLHILGAALDRVLRHMKRTMEMDERRQFSRFWAQFPISLF